MGYIAFILSYFFCWVFPKCLYANSVCYIFILNIYRTWIKNFLYSFFYLFYLCFPLPANFVGGYSFSSWDYNAALLIGKLTSLGSSRAGVGTAGNLASILLSSSGGYWYSFSSCLICINACYFLINFSYNYIATNLSSRL